MNAIFLVCAEVKDDKDAIGLAKNIAESTTGIKKVTVYEAVESGEAVTAEALGETYPNVDLPFRRRVGEFTNQ